MPSAIAPLGTTMALGTSAPAPTRALVSTMALCSTTDPEPTSAWAWMVHPSRCARWPTTHSSPTVVGVNGVVCSTAPSWMEVRAPTTMRPSSPRSTAPGQMDDSAPISTDPMITAPGAM